MKHLRHLTMLLFFAALLLWLAPALVLGGEGTREAPPPEEVAHGMLLLQPADMPQREAAQSPEAERRIRVALRTAPCEARCAEDCVPRDGNGWLITGRTWPRTVYAVCPPEGVFG